MSSGDRNLKRAARAVQAECGVTYTTARNWIEANRGRIFALIVMDGEKPRWREYPAAAVGLWRRDHPEETS